MTKHLVFGLVVFLAVPTECFHTSTSKNRPSCVTTLSARRGRKQSPSKQVVATKTRPATKQRPPKTQITPLKIASDCTVHVSQILADDPWWDNETINQNPYGARVWPASLGIAQYLWQQKIGGGDTSVFEVGCGTGLISQTAALAGAGRVRATDVSSVALELTRQGWKQTAPEGRQQTILTTSKYDIANPLPSDLSGRTLLVASCVLYEGDLGEAVAERVKEAHQRGMWILLGDDDTGYREGGRQRFMDRLQGIDGPLRWQTGTVQCPQLGWREKPFAYLELNSPKKEMIARTS